MNRMDQQSSRSAVEPDSLPPALMSDPAKSPRKHPPTRQVNRISWGHRLLLTPVWILLQCWLRTLRIRVRPDDLQRIQDLREPTLILLWHNELISAGYIYRRWRRARPMAALISASKDGAWLEAFFSLAGLKAVRGSSSFRGRESLRELLDLAKQGYDLGITPDGPRGPCYDFKPGAALLAKKAGLRVLLVHSHYTRAWRARSWDGFFIPLPFSSLTVTCQWWQPPPGIKDLREIQDHLAESLRRLKK